MKNFIVILLIALATFHLAMAAPEKWKCGKDSDGKVDDIVSKILTVGRDDIKFPENKAQLKTYCKEMRTYVSQVEQYKDQCLKEQTKQTVSVVIYSLKSMLNSYCKSQGSKKVKELLASASCANRINKDYEKCLTSSIDTFMAVNAMSDSKGQLAQLCW